jgi:BirA family biotin operon repressor/biotin-[acetyl-CoA-carboxylase] ligase
LTGRSPPARVVRLGAVGSTNDEAMALLRADGSPVWVTATRQTAGRGRRGRPWVSKGGNLYASFAFPVAMPAEARAFLPLAAAVALREAISASADLPVSLKWPNDVLVNGRKAAGILIETETTASGRMRAVAGFGVNLAHAPADVPATTLCAHAPWLTVDALFDALRPALASVLAQLSAPGGLAVLRGRWLSAAAGVGEPIVVRLDGDTREGRFLDLDSEGRLVLEEPGGGTARIAAGEVFMRAERP